MKATHLWLLLVACAAGAQQTPSGSTAGGAASFTARCAVCHGGDGNGTDRGPSLLAFVAANPDAQIATLIRTGVRAMPAHTIADPEMTDLLAFLHTLGPLAGASPSAPSPRTIRLNTGESLQGDVLNETNFDLQLASADGRIHLLSRDGEVYSEPSLRPEVDWPRYDGSFTSNRNSTLAQINRSNVRSLKLQWMFPITWAPRLEATPVVVDGVMYVTAANAVFALDARDGRQLWSYRRARTAGLLGEAAGGANRGVGIAGSRVLMLTDNAHLLALDKNNGKLLWDVAMTDWPVSQYGATGAPLIIGDHAIVGVAGGEEGARGFVASYDVTTGQRQWQFWSIPKPGEKLSETWVGSALEHGCGATWMSGSYDPQLDLIYWAVGNPCPDFNGADRQGDNLYTNSVLALKPESGELKWYFQFTPHDTHDWDADEPMMLVDTSYEGRPRKLLVQADRNGFFFLLDRTNGQFLRATPFVSKITWASGYTSEGKAIVLPNSEPTLEGNVGCPASATNWMSAAYNAATKLFYLAATDRCSSIKLVPAPFEMGKRFFNGAGSRVPGGTHSIRALDVQTGKIVWDYVQTGDGSSASGTLSTDGGLVFFGGDSGVFTALDARTGKPLWHFAANEKFWASPMTYMLAGKQYVCIASSAGYLAFALPD
ncbi:MAG: PQQ-binding-like beta-propeller repeat protein [Steroidobacteraceae bacterium]|jgi:alcohol dehydrogenase (cytochrome c)